MCNGIKSAVLSNVNSCQIKGEEILKEDVAASFQRAVIEVLVYDGMHAIQQYKQNKFDIAGGVASNSSLRQAFIDECEKRGIEFYYHSPIFCTVNAAMIGVAGYYDYLKGSISGLDLNAVAILRLGANSYGI